MPLKNNRMSKRKKIFSGLIAALAFIVFTAATVSPVNDKSLK